MKQLYFFIISIFILATLSGCDGKKETIPAYLKIDAVTFKSSGATQGTDLQNITEAWVFIDDDLQGIYDLPCNIPILSLGEHSLKIRGGIKRNGIADSRVDYPFFDHYLDTLTFESNKTIEIAPVVKYFKDVEVWDESFEDAGVKLNTFSTSDTNMTLTNNPTEVFEGNGSGKLTLTASKNFARFYTAQNFSLPLGNPVFVEMHYKTNDFLRVGLLTHSPSGNDIFTTVLYLSPTSKKTDLVNGWNKVYVNLSEEINKATAGSKFDVFFEVVRNNSVPSDKSPDEIVIQLDNIKVVYPN